MPRTCIVALDGSEYSERIVERRAHRRAAGRCGARRRDRAPGRRVGPRRVPRRGRGPRGRVVRPHPRVPRPARRERVDHRGEGRARRGGRDDHPRAAWSRAGDLRQRRRGGHPPHRGAARARWPRVRRAGRGPGRALRRAARVPRRFARRRGGAAAAAASFAAVDRGVGHGRRPCSDEGEATPDWVAPACRCSPTPGVDRRVHRAHRRSGRRDRRARRAAARTRCSA